MVGDAAPVDAITAHVAHGGLDRRGLAHGTVLLHERGEVVWQFVDDTRYHDVDALVRRARLLPRTDAASQNNDTIRAVSARQSEMHRRSKDAEEFDRL